MTKLKYQIEQAITYLQASNQTVALTGAGISTPSGIPDFRSPTSGVWEQHDPAEVASIYAFRENPRNFYTWLRPLAKLILAAQPNPAHEALAQLEKYGPLEALITQNIDMLHHRAGSRSVLEIHGHLRRATCMGCEEKFIAPKLLAAYVETGDMPRCKLCGEVLKPDIILFGELLPMRLLKEAQMYALTCDLILVVGSSLEVAPAGDLPALAKQTGARLIIINHDPTHIDHQADLLISADVAEVLPQLAAPFLPSF